MRFRDFVAFSFVLSFLLRGSAKQCGKDKGGLSDIISSSTFEEMLPYRNDRACPAKGFYTYEAFIKAAKEFPDFGNTGNLTTRKREIAAFFGQTSHETTGGLPCPCINLGGCDFAPGGRYSLGYCFIRAIAGGTHCQNSVQYPCCRGKQYYGRGPIQLSWNYNYGLCSQDLWNNVTYLLCNPDVVETDPVVSFKTAIWFWMTPQNNKPSSHDVITDIWRATSSDIAANRLPGYGVITNIINGGTECGNGQNAAGEDRIGFYRRYCDIFGIDYGDNLDCYRQRPFGYGLLKTVGTI